MIAPESPVPINSRIPDGRHSPIKFEIDAAADDILIQRDRTAADHYSCCLAMHFAEIGEKILDLSCPHIGEGILNSRPGSPTSLYFAVGGCWIRYNQFHIGDRQAARSKEQEAVERVTRAKAGCAQPITLCFTRKPSNRGRAKTDRTGAS